MIMISTIEELQQIGQTGEYPLDGEYQLANDIDASATSGWNGGKGFIPIGTTTDSFTGTLDGNGKRIDSLYMNWAREEYQYVGLFSVLKYPAQVKNLGFSNLYVGGYIAGGIVATMYSGALIRNCYTKGQVYKRSTHSIGAGGLIGYWIGGELEHSYSTCRVTGGLWNRGGLVGSKGTSNTEEPVSCYYPTDIGNPDNEIGTGVTSAEMLLQSTYDGWDFEDLWTTDENTLTPVFRLPVGFLFKDHFKVYSQDKITYTGLLDTLFDPNVELEYNKHVTCTAIQSDGKILIGGSFTTVAGVTRTYLARLSKNGALDTSFNVSINLTVNSIVIQSDGKILISGFFTTVNGVSQQYLARLNTDGTLDTGFTPVVDGRFLFSIVIQSDGKILISGNFTTVNGVSQQYLARLNTDGTLDTGFTPVVDNEVRCIQVLSSGKMYISGFFLNVDDVSRKRIARLESDGRLDPGFNCFQDMIATYVFRVTEDETQLIVTSREPRPSNWFYARLYRINSDGSNDTSFSNLLFDTLLESYGTQIDTIAIQSDGKILVGGVFAVVDEVLRNCLARLNTDGTLDTDFNVLMTITETEGHNRITDIKIQDDGKILLCGRFATIQDTDRRYFARINPDIEAKYIKEEFFWIPEYVSDTTNGAFEITDITGIKYRLYLERNENGYSRWKYENTEWSNWSNLIGTSLSHVKMIAGPSDKAGTCIIKSRCVRNNVIAARDEEDLYEEGAGYLDYYSIFYISAQVNIQITGLNNTDEAGANTIKVSEPELLIGDLPEVDWNIAPDGVVFYDSLDGLSFDLSAGQNAYIYINRRIDQESEAGLYNRLVVLNYIVEDDPDAETYSAELIGTHLIGRTDAVKYNLYGEESTDPDSLPSVSDNLLASSSTLPVTYEPALPDPGNTLYVSMRINQVNRYGAESLNRFLEHIVSIDSDGADAEIPPVPVLDKMEFLTGGQIRITATITIDPDKTIPTRFGCQCYDEELETTTTLSKGINSGVDSVTGYFYFDKIDIPNLFKIRLYSDSETKDRQYTDWYTYESIYDTETYLDQFNMVGSHSASTFLVPIQEGDPWETQTSGLLTLTFSVDENEITYDSSTVLSVAKDDTDFVFDIDGYVLLDGYTDGSPNYDLGEASIVAGYEVDTVNDYVYLVSNWRRIVCIDTINKTIKAPNIYQISFPSHNIELPIAQTNFAVYWNVRSSTVPYVFSYMKIQHLNSDVGADSVGLFINNIEIVQ